MAFRFSLCLSFVLDVLIGRFLFKSLAYLSDKNDD
ncbi:hypothetical protein P23_2710 [Acinetobacter calcoaceticus]|nr:hypothetical protein P23_2710 [Acinetobacter calcoaceticus]